MKSQEDLHKDLRIRKEVLGENHASTIASMNGIALVTHKTSRVDEAIKIMENVVSLRSNVLGLQHGDTQHSRRVLVEWRKELASKDK
jgi:hypothetical protein